MDKFFICLANSYKHGNRCIAGIEITRDLANHTYRIIRNSDHTPKWIRPVNRTTDGGAIPNNEATGITILDIVQISDVILCPDQGAQSENCYYTSIAKVSRIRKTPQVFLDMVDDVHTMLFNNRGAAVTHNDYGNLSYSLALVNPDELEFYLLDRNNRVPQPKARFTFQETQYDIPVTDPEFRRIIEDSVDRANGFTCYYLAISLGTLDNGFHSKLIAGVIAI